LFAHVGELGLGGGGVGGVELEFDVFADADMGGVVAEVLEAGFDGVACGVGDGGAEGDVDSGLIGAHGGRTKLRFLVYRRLWLGSTF
jgi:hypothetical protein